LKRSLASGVLRLSIEDQQIPLGLTTIDALREINSHRSAHIVLSNSDAKQELKSHMSGNC